ncbi:restriction endonuclease subunit S [Nocardia sp. 004]|uniref:restriction endonuclease subunit S n=1 Tax=Nocardia sp. 004 TaxID=3385978 RepID=UPI0039A092C1
MTIATEWKETAVGSLASVCRGASPRPIASSRWFDTSSNVRWVRIADVNRSNGRTLQTTTQALSSDGIARSRYLEAGTLIMSIAATVGIPVITGIPTCIHDGFVALENLKVDQRFLLYLLKSSEGRLRESGQSGSQMNVNTDIVKGLHVRIPVDRREQERIAAALWDIDDLITTLERLIAKKQAIKQGMMQQLLTGRTRLPGFSHEWVDITLGDHVSYIKTVALSRAQLDGNSPLKYLHYGDIHTRSSVMLNAASEDMPRVSKKLARGAGLLQQGDLVFADASEDPAGVGKSVEIVDIPDAGIVPGLHTIAARFDKEILADGFKAYLQFIPAFRDQLLRLAAGTKVLATTRSYISSVSLSVPEIAEQKAIAKVLFDTDREIEALRIRHAKARNIKTGMMQQLLTGRTRLPVEATA